MTGWETLRVEDYSTAGGAETAIVLMAGGWEPFAVTADAAFETLHLRRQRPPLVERPASVGPVCAWAKCVTCGTDIYQWHTDQDTWQWEHQGGTPPVDHPAEPAT